MAMSSKKIFSYPISCLRDTANNISDVFLSGIWLTGITIGLVKKSTNEIKKSIIGLKEKPEPPMVIKSSEQKDKVLLNLSEDAKSFEEELTKLEKSFAKLEKRVERR